MAMYTKTKLVRVLLPPETLEEARQLATKDGRTLSSFFRKLALRAPEARPRWLRIAGIEAMDIAGSALGEAVRCEHGRSRDEIPAIMRHLHERILALRIEESSVPATVPAMLWRRKAMVAEDEAPNEAMRMVAFRATEDEVAEMRANAACFGLPLSTYIRRRLQRRPLRLRRPPLEGLSSVVRCVALMKYASGFREAGADALKLVQEADAMRWRLEETGCLSSRS